MPFKISEDHRHTLQQLMHLRKVYNCPLSCQNTLNYLLFNITHSWYTQRFQTTIRWKNLSRLMLKMLHRPLVWITKKLWVKIKSEFVALCCCTELRCLVSHVRQHRIPILNNCNQALQQEQCTFVKHYDDIISLDQWFSTGVPRKTSVPWKIVRCSAGNLISLTSVPSNTGRKSLV